MPDVTHTTACLERQAAYDAYFERWPEACPICLATGIIPAPNGGLPSLCPNCAHLRVCPQCGLQLPAQPSVTAKIRMGCNNCGFNWQHTGPDPLVCDAECTSKARFLSIALWDQQSRRWKIPTKLAA